MSNLTCMICGYSHPTMISASHLKKHSISTKEYKDAYPGAILRIQSEESKAKTSASKKGRSPWNKGLNTGPNEKLSASKLGQPNLLLRGQTRTIEQREKISRGVKTALIKMDDETKTALAERRRAAYDQRKRTGYISPLLGTHHSEETKRQISDSLVISATKKRELWLEQLQTRLFDDKIIVRGLTQMGVSLTCSSCSHDFIFSRQYFSPSSQRNHNSRTAQLCPACFPREIKKSKLEIELLEWMRAKRPDLNIVSGNRSQIYPLELDIWIPELSTAIEVTGTYWHTEKVSSQAGRSKYHLYEKYQQCQKKGIRLFTIYEDELKHQRDIVLSRLSNFLNLPVERIFARKTAIRKISLKESTAFLDANHIQRADRPLIALGAFLGEELISVMTFKRTTFVKGGDGSQMELSRFASKINVSVVGIASKMLAHFTRNENTDKLDLISYSDNRWSVGDVYEKLGFTKVSSSKPGYFYVSMQAGDLQGIRVHRSNFMKHRLSRIFNKQLDLSLSEYDLMQQNGYDRIWDCGTTKWELKYNGPHQ